MLVQYKSFNYSVDRYEFYTGIVLLIILGFVFIFLLTLMTFQILFISRNTTTREYIKNKFVAGNPFDKGFCENFNSFFKNIDDYKDIINYNEAAQRYRRELIYSEQPKNPNKLIDNNESQNEIALTDNSV